MSLNLTQKVIHSHLVEGDAVPGQEVALRIDQTLTQDATGTLVMLELESMEIDRVATELSVQYVDHNLLQQDAKNADDHIFLESACRRFGVRFSRPGNGVSHPLHQEHFGVPGRTLLGSDSHTCAAGAIGMLAVGAGGVEVALAMAGEPLRMQMPLVWGVELTGQLPEWVSAKDVILEMLRRHSVRGGVGRIVEYYGPGLGQLSAMDRHVIANMGAELGATSSIFPSDSETRRFLAARGRPEDWREFSADTDAEYDVHESIDLSALEPLIAMPASPDNVAPVREIAGEPIYQAYLGSSANPGYRDFAVAAQMVREKAVDPAVSFDVNPTSRWLLQDLARNGHLQSFLACGARIHQAGCNGCIGMGQAPATDQTSLRTTPRNFPGRSGTREDKVCLVSPETATASALAGRITDPRDLGARAPRTEILSRPTLDTRIIVPPLPRDHAQGVKLVKGPNITSLPDLQPVAEEVELPVLLKLGDDVSTDAILPAGAATLPLRSNIPEISKHSFRELAPSYYQRSIESRESDGHAIVAGRNYGQGSSREHAALAPRFLGLVVVVAQSFARIHRQNLINFGVLPLCLLDDSQSELLPQGQSLRISGIRKQIGFSDTVTIEAGEDRARIKASHGLSSRERRVLLAGGAANALRRRQLRQA